MLDYHVHLERGPLTREWLAQFLEQAHTQGVTELGIVEHLYLFPEARHLLENAVPEEDSRNMALYFSLIEGAKSEGINVKLGLEVDYVPGKEAEIAVLLQGLPLDFVIGSVHWMGDWAFDIDKDGWELRKIDEVYRQYYDTLARAAESRLFDILGHPGNIAYFGHRLEPQQLDELEERFLQRIASVPICLEINTGGYLRPAQELFPRLAMVERIKQYGFDIVVSSDAHRPEDVGHAISETRQRLKQMGFSAVQSFAARKKRAVAL